MALELPYRALITPAELQRDAQSSTSVAFTGADSAAAIAAIIGVTDRIETYLARELIVRPLQMRLTGCEWGRTGITQEGYAYGLWAEAWPAVQIDTAGVTAGKSAPGGQLLYADSRLDEVSGFAGYRRADQVLAEPDPNPDELEGLPVGAGMELEGLTTLPPVLPYDIRDVAVDLALYRIMLRREGRYGLTRKAQTVGQMMVTIEAQDLEYEERVLAQLFRYRRLA